mmetsp:Transcript_14098/g.10148  ORF Transcript_14098/g.10148 Transcript_14098/m.10148 type:complete len:83 (-) Transcript_14098:681-929(-)
MFGNSPKTHRVKQVQSKRSEYQTSSRPDERESPRGARHSYFHNSPHYRVNPTFNFWHDVKYNVMTRTQWEDKNDTYLPKDTF